MKVKCKANFIHDDDLVSKRYQKGIIKKKVIIKRYYPKKLSKK